MAERKVILSCVGVTKSFGGVVAVNDFSLEVYEGERLGLIGPNGAGKTTLFNVIAGVYRPNTGRILLRSRDITGLTPEAISRLGVCRTFQTPRPFRNLTTHQNIILATLFARHGRSGSASYEASVEELIRLVGLNGKGNTLSGELTLPELRKLELARALAVNPDLLLLDETVAGLNETETEEACSLIRKISEGGITLFLVEHNLRAVMTLAERIVVIDQGRKIAEGIPREVVSDKLVIEAYLGEGYA